MDHRAAAAGLPHVTRPAMPRTSSGHLVSRLIPHAASRVSQAPPAAPAAGAAAAAVSLPADTSTIAAIPSSPGAGVGAIAAPIASPRRGTADQSLALVDSLWPASDTKAKPAQVTQTVTQGVKSVTDGNVSSSSQSPLQEATTVESVTTTVTASTAQPASVEAPTPSSPADRTDVSQLTPSISAAATPAVFIAPDADTAPGTPITDPLRSPAASSPAPTDAESKFVMVDRSPAGSMRSTEQQDAVGCATGTPGQGASNNAYTVCGSSQAQTSPALNDAVATPTVAGAAASAAMDDNNSTGSSSSPASCGLSALGPPFTAPQVLGALDVVIRGFEIDK